MRRAESERIMNIREAGEADLVRLQEIYNEAVRNTTATFDLEEKDLDNRREWLAAHQGRYVILVAEVSRCVAGYASLSVYRERKAFDQTTEVSIYIHPDFRGQKIGTALMEAIMQEAVARGFANVVSLITGDNEISLALHRKFGFADCGRIREAGVKFGRKLDLCILQRLL